MGVIGAHALLYSSEPEALRAVLRDVFGWKHVDAGGGWLKTIAELEARGRQGGRRAGG